MHGSRIRLLGCNWMWSRTGRLGFEISKDIGFSEYEFHCYAKHTKALLSMRNTSIVVARSIKMVL